MIIGNYNQNRNIILSQNILIDSLCKSLKNNDTKNANLITSKISNDSELLKELNNSSKLKKISKKCNNKKKYYVFVYSITFN